MNPMEPFEKLAEIARTDAPPPMDVSGQVIERISAVRETRETPLVVLTAFSAAAAALACVIAVQAWAALSDPLIEMLSIARW